MSANIINFRPKKYGVDYHREEMERCGAEYIDALLSDDIEWVTTKGVLLTFYDEMTGKWRHEWSPTEQWILEQEQRKRDEEKRGVMSNISVERRGMANREIRAALNGLMTACGLSGQSGTEVLFNVLCEAIRGVEASHAEGLCYDVNYLLAEQIEIALSAYDEHCQQQ